MPQFSLTLWEVVILMAGGIGLGLTIHFVIISKKALRHYGPSPMNRKMDDWKLRYFNDMEKKEQELFKAAAEIERLKNEKESLEEANDNLSYKLSKSADAAKDHSNVRPAPMHSENYLQELIEAQKGLLEQNRKISQLLENIQSIQESEFSTSDLKAENEELRAEVEELKMKLAAKDKEIIDIKQTTHVSHEMSSMLDSAYREFNVLQEKIIKLEGQVSSSQRITMEYEDLREGFYKASRDLEEQRNRLNEVMHENRELQINLSETNEKLREANFQRQQLQKRVAYLEELNQDLQSVAEANRKLESQLKRIGELESLLNVMAEEREQLARNQVKASSV